MSLRLAFYCSCMNIQHPDSLCCGSTESAILCMEVSTDISNALIVLQITTAHTSTSTTCGKSQQQLKNEQPWKEPTSAYIHHVLGITSFQDSKQTIITLVECSKFQIILITIYICNYNKQLDMLLTYKTSLLISFIRCKIRFSGLKSLRL